MLTYHPQPLIINNMSSLTPECQQGGHLNTLIYHQLFHVTFALPFKIYFSSLLFQGSERRSIEQGGERGPDSMEASSDSESSDVMGSDKKAAKPKKEKKSL